MKILAIETSCDETAVSLIESEKTGSLEAFSVLGNALASQAKLHAKYGGVFPNLAKREHAKAAVPLLLQVLKEAKLFAKKGTKKTALTSKQEESLSKLLAKEPELFEAVQKVLVGIKKPKIDAIAVTSGPGLEPALWVGINFAKTLSFLWNIPVYPVHHMEGHIFSSVLIEKKVGRKTIYEIPKISFPAISLLISGGHTELVRINKWMKYEVLGETRDDAVGEAFDKVARMLDLPYPGGPEISKLAERVRINSRKSEIEPLPRPMINSKDLSFSFSGLKTSVLYLLQKLGKPTETQKESIAYEFEEAVTDVLVKKSADALETTNAKTLIVGGGVSANKNIREKIARACKSIGVTAYLPDRKLSTDNALMIAIAAYYHITHKKKPQKTIVANGNWSL